MGYLFKGVCYAEISQAKQVVCSQAATDWQSGSTFYTSSCVSTDYTLDSFDLCRRADGGTCTTLSIPYPAFSDCAHVYTADAILDWSGAALLLFATLFGLRHLYEIFAGKNDA